MNTDPRSEVQEKSNQATADSPDTVAPSDHEVERATGDLPVPSATSDTSARSKRQPKPAASPRPKRQQLDKPIQVEALARKVGVSEGEVVVRIAKAYLGFWKRSGADCSVTGEIHSINWGKYEPHVNGVRWCPASTILSCQRQLS